MRLSPKRGAKRLVQKQQRSGTSGAKKGCGDGGGGGDWAAAMQVSGTNLAGADEERRRTMTGERKCEAKPGGGFGPT